MKEQYFIILRHLIFHYDDKCNKFKIYKYRIFKLLVDLFILVGIFNTYTKKS